MKLLEAIVGRLGVIKNQLLAFVIAGALIIFFFAKDLAASPLVDVREEGLRMFWVAIGLLIFGACFYVYAWFRLPSSVQEIAFEEEGQAVVRLHRERQRANTGQILDNA